MHNLNIFAEYKRLEIVSGDNDSTVSTGEVILYKGKQKQNKGSLNKLVDSHVFSLQNSTSKHRHLDMDKEIIIKKFKLNNLFAEKSLTVS